MIPNKSLIIHEDETRLELFLIGKIEYTLNRAYIVVYTFWYWIIHNHIVPLVSTNLL